MPGFIVRASDDVAEILAVAEQIAVEVLRPLASNPANEGQWPIEAMRELQASGLAGLMVPRADGGLGQGLLTLTRVCEILGRECASSGLCFGMHCVGTAVLAAKATSFQRSEFLRPIAEGKHLTTLALSEPGTGAHFYLPMTEMISTSEGFRVNGIKSFVTNGGHADSYVVSTAASEDVAQSGQFSCVIIPNDAPGIHWGQPWEGIGMRGNSSLQMSLQDVLVRQDHLLGEEGDQIWYVFQVVAPFFLVAMAGTYLGLSSAAYHEARSHLISRKHAHSGQGLGKQSVLQHRMGEIWAMLERTRQFVYYAARQGDSGAEDALPALCSCKAEVAECAVQVVNECMTLMGGIGYQQGGRMERLLRDARAAHVMAPTTDLLRIWAGRALLDEPLLGD